MRTRIQLRLPHREQRSSWFSCLLLAVVLCVEVLGRSGTSDLHDGVAISLLATVVLLSYVAWGRRALRWARPFAQLFDSVVLARVRARKFEIGIDLRRSPPVPSGMPPLIRDLLVGATVLLAALLVLVFAGRESYRAVASQTLYIGYLLSLLALWVALLVTVAASILLPVAFIHDAFAARRLAPTPNARHTELVAIGGYFAAVLVLGVSLPVWVPNVLAACALGSFLLTMWWSQTPSVTLLWRRRGGEAVRSLEWRSYETCCALIVAVSFFDLLLLSLGGAAIGIAPRDGEVMWVTTKLGAVAAWLGGMALTSGSIFATGWLAGQRRRDPAQPCPTSIHVRGAGGDLGAVSQVFRRLGWTARCSPSAPDASDVCVELHDSPLPRSEGRARWPLPISRKSIEVPELHQLLARRDEIQRRRSLLRGLERLFKHAARRAYERGQGFWLAPHCWYISGMTRDVDEDHCDLRDGTVISGVIGPAYHRLLPRGARQHLHTILRALEIDLVFLEDGVGFRGLRRVLRVLFEHFDMHGGKRRIEERHFGAQPGLRIIVHEYELGNPLRRRGYPEPDYEQLGRARILHVFKDRGEPRQPQPDPVDRDDVPIPVLGSA